LFFLFSKSAVEDDGTMPMAQGRWQ